MYGDGLNVRDWLYVGDHCAAIREVLARGRLGETYNVGGWNEKTNLDVVHPVRPAGRAQAARGSYRDQITFVKDRPGHDRRYAIDARKLERELGWKPAETFETGLRKTVQWYLDNRAWVQDVMSGNTVTGWPSNMRFKAAGISGLLVTGCNGQVGFELRRSGAAGSCDCAGPRAATCRVRTRFAVVRELRPDVVVNPAAYTAVDRAESDVEAAFAINATAAGVLAGKSRPWGLLVYYSTDYVFDGRKAGSYVETDAVAPQSVYGKSKLAGELAIAATGAAALILRTSWVAGAHGNNFAKTMLKLARERDSLRVIADQFGAPTTAALIADVTAQIVARHWLFGERALPVASIIWLRPARRAGMAMPAR